MIWLREVCTAVVDTRDGASTEFQITFKRSEVSLTPQKKKKLGQRLVVWRTKKSEDLIDTERAVFYHELVRKCIFGDY